MKFRRVALSQAEGHVLGHNVSHEGRRVLKKGRRLGPGELSELERIGQEYAYVAILEPGDVTEDAAALRIGRALADAAGLVSRPAYGGRLSLSAPGHGLLAVDLDALLELNSLPGVTLATLPRHSVVGPGRHVATLKVIPFALPEPTVSAAEALARRRPVFFRQLLQRRTGILVSGAESRRAILFEAYRAALGERLEALGQRSVAATYVALGGEPEGELAAAIEDQLASGLDLLIVVGETATMDADDLAPRAIARAGGRVDVVGAPVFPGNLLLLAHRERCLILGAPGCVRSRARNIVDLLLPRLLLGERLQPRDVAELGHGGLLEAGAGEGPEGASDG